MSALRTSPRSTPPPSGLIPLGGWRERAACLTHPRLKPSAWDDELVGVRETAAKRAERHGAAKAACLGCPVIGPCLTDLDLDYDRGIRGGHDVRDIAEARDAARDAARGCS